MATLKKIFSNIYLYILWALLAFFFWSWIFGLVNDTTTFKKVSIYIDCAAMEELDLTLELEEDLPQGIKMVKLHTKDYVVFDEPTMLMGDILVLKESELPYYVEALSPIAPFAQAHPELAAYTWEGETVGIRVYDAASGQGILNNYVSFLAPGEPPEDFYMVFLADSRHLGSLNGSADDAAFQLAEKLLTLP